MAPTGIDLFCGLGGLSLAMKQAGVTPILGVDVWSEAVSVYKKNFPRADAAQGDLSAKPFRDALVDRWRGKASLVVGGVPCQSFSSRNIRTRTGSKLPFHFVDLAARLEPDFVLMEEVPGLASMLHSPRKTYAQALVDAFRRRGYSAEYRVLNAADHGVAQSRRRLFMVARRGAHASVFPDVKKSPRIPVSRVISPPYDPITEYAEEVLRTNTVKKMGYKVLDLDRPSPTVSTHYNVPGAWGAVPLGDGKFGTLGTRNALRVQGFPASWQVTGRRNVDRVLIGNAVPPPMAKRVLSELFSPKKITTKHEG